MGLSIGDKDCTSGLSKRIYDNLKAEWLNEFNYDLGGESADNQTTWKLVCYAVAKGVVDELEANAELDSAVATIETTDSGLQRDPATTNNCLGPSLQKTIVVTGGIT